MDYTNEALKSWTGGFGNQYVDRNDYADWKIDNGIKIFSKILENLSLKSLLEVGSNIGLNLLALQNIFAGKVDLYAIEPNKKAFKSLNSNPDLKLKNAWNCDAYKIPINDFNIDLVFTCGVLIHIPPEQLLTATQEIVRVAKKYVLCIEYFSHTPVEIPYHGETGLLFKRDFGSFYLDNNPNLKVLDYGFIWQREFANYDNLNWWLFEKVTKN